MDPKITSTDEIVANSIIDIRKDPTELRLLELMRSSLKGPSDCAPSLPDLLLWDEQGLKTFEEITYLDDYYLTNNEISLLEQHGKDIALKIKPNSMLIELGCGNLRKMMVLLRALDDIGRAVDYYALDLSYPELQRSLSMVLPGIFKHVRCHGLLGTYEDARSWLALSYSVQRPKCVISLGSSIGNSTRIEAAEFLSGFSKVLDLTKDGQVAEQGSTMIIGLDACRSPGRLHRAYNDSSGVWNRFFLNGLKHANSILGYDAFKSDDWTTEGGWNDFSGRYEQFVIPRNDFEFEGVCLKAGQEVLIFQSCKYSPSDRAELWSSAGLKEIDHWNSQDGSYGLHMLSMRESIIK